MNLVTDFVTALIEEAVIYLQNAVGTQWHTQLARHCIDRIMRGNVFYALRNCDGRVTDAEQRISEEVYCGDSVLPSLWVYEVASCVDVGA